MNFGLSVHIPSQSSYLQNIPSDSLSLCFDRHQIPPSLDISSLSTYQNNSPNPQPFYFPTSPLPDLKCEETLPQHLPFISFPSFDDHPAYLSPPSELHLLPQQPLIMAPPLPSIDDIDRSFFQSIESNIRSNVLDRLGNAQLQTSPSFRPLSSQPQYDLNVQKELEETKSRLIQSLKIGFSELCQVEEMLKKLKNMQDAASDQDSFENEQGQKDYEDATSLICLSEGEEDGGGSQEQKSVSESLPSPSLSLSSSSPSSPPLPPPPPFSPPNISRSYSDSSFQVKRKTFGKSHDHQVNHRKIPRISLLSDEEGDDDDDSLRAPSYEID